MAKILYEIMLDGFLCLTKPAFMRRPWRITPYPAVHGWVFLRFVGIISTVSKPLRYALRREYVCARGTRGLRSLRCGEFVSLCASRTRDLHCGEFALRVVAHGRCRERE